MARLAQVALCTADLPRTIRVFVEALGFGDAGGRARWGSYAAQVQELPTGEDTCTMMWWLVGGQDFVQVELFQHTSPPQRPVRPDWRPDDLGWSRFSVGVADFDATLDRLARVGVTVRGPVGSPGGRRASFVEPGSSSLVELVELVGERASAAGESPTLVSVTASVADLHEASRLFRDAFGLVELPSDAAAEEDRESLWGSDRAPREHCVLRAGEVLVEFVRYDPPGRPPVPGALLSDQGIMNIALGYRERDEFVAALSALADRGFRPTTAPPPVAGGVYLRVVELLSLELLLVPPHLDESYGFVARDLSPPGTAFDPSVSAGLTAPQA